ncbi:GntR family transcriptional regulator [Anaerostipes sp.]|uniref:GntR family transcriptional regulator n=1 Tax=Anaerostipes sp. TaxID=1872530 RepID=UPI0025BA4594|nr:GntR family transcriptional regulator [Anaerostipes sp.]MBS7009363.1 GntR family transcriptional regulator [Anaerostipes sp.]
MELESGIYKLVFEYYEARIVYGYYEYGDKLPSIPKICAVFHMAPATVRAGLAALEKQGYIRIDARKASMVTYKADRVKRRRLAAEYFVPRKKEIQDLIDSNGIFIKPIWDLAVNSLKKEDWINIKQELGQSSEVWGMMTIRFFLLVLSKLNNSLMINLYWELIRFLRFPYTGISGKREPECKEFVHETMQELMDRYETGFKDGVSRLFEFIEEARKEYSIEETEQIPFEWNIYRQRPQLCYTLVCHVIRDIGKGIYPVESFLPSLPQMAKHYDVSVSTVRRSLSILNSAGITQSFQGKGTQIKMNVRQINFEQPEIADGLRLYRESLQLMHITIRPVLTYTYGNASETERNIYKQRFLRLLEEKNSYLCFEISLTFIVEHCPRSIIQECYAKLRELTAWGYPFTLYRLNGKSMHTEYARTIQEAADFLNAGDLSAFAGCLEDLIEREEQNIRTVFSKY